MTVTRPPRRNSGRNGARSATLLVLAFLLAGCGLPGYQWSSSSAGGSVQRTVTVQKGDTLYSLARRHNVELRDLIEINGMRPPYIIEVGQRLRLPRPIIHVVRKGDTLYSISRGYGLNMDTVARANGLRPPYTIYVGQELRLSESVAPPARQAAASAPGARLPAIPSPPPRAGGKFLVPVKGKIISTYGPKSGGLHNDGINIAAPRGAEVRAVDNGVVAYAGDGLSGFGNLLLIKHDDGWISAYAHNDSLLVKRGEQVKKGQTVARVGSTGSVNTPQLHFELRRGRKAVDPRPYLSEQLALSE